MIQHWKCIAIEFDQSLPFFVFPNFLLRVHCTALRLWLVTTVVTSRATPPSHAASAFWRILIMYSLTDVVGLGAAPDSGIQREAVICPLFAR
jgi:hypothetical protein